MRVSRILPAVDYFPACGYNACACVRPAPACACVHRSTRENAINQRHMLKATVRLAALHCLARKRRLHVVQSSLASRTRAHSGVDCLRCPRVPLRCGSSTVEFVCTRGHSEVRTHAERGPPAGDIFLSADLYCTSRLSLNTCISGSKDSGVLVF